MHIDRSNYELWFTDWLDGNLNNLQVEQLKLFLDQNHDLREELDDLISLNLLNLVSSPESFRYKEQLKKSPSEMSEDQFEFLCAAYLENDLSGSQKKELEEITDADPDKKRTFELLQKTILAPVSIGYKHKRLLRKLTTAQKVIRLSVIGISAAAAISIIIIIYPVIPGTSTLKQSIIAHNITPDSTFQKPSQVLAVVSKAHILPPATQKGYLKMPTISKSTLGVPIAIGIGVNLSGGALKTTSSNDSSLRIFNKQEEAVIKVPVNPEVDLGRGIVTNTLIASNLKITYPAAEDERSKAGKFISKIFREKFLKEETPSDTPLKGYEIAEAGITGLNKLLGWQMALNLENDENGQPKAVNFSSGILKIQAPVKKREAQP
jgi:hypothetical protein